VRPNLEASLDRNSQSRLHALDGLRAVAVALVLTHHLGAASLGDSLTARGHKLMGFLVGTIGTSGVELFFVLSGVVLARPYLRGGRVLDVPTYFRRRVQRLFPPYLFAWLFAGFAIYFAGAHPTAWSATATIPPFHLQSWLLQLGIVYFGDHYSWAWWSLTVECLFYLLIPLLIPLLLRVPARTATALVLLAVTVGVALCVPMSALTTHPVADHFNWLVAYGPCFMAGLLMSRIDLPRSVAAALGVIGLAFLAAAYELPYVSRHIGYGLIHTGIVSLALDPKTRLARELSRWHLVWLGERSYSLFLTHCTVIVLVYYTASMFMLAHGARWLLVTRALSIPLSMLVAMLLFSGIERRFARGLVTEAAFWPWRTRPRGEPPTGQPRDRR
jgi:peptidoglycan/LPS O-acetylase OafA/YrhL